MAQAKVKTAPDVLPADFFDKAPEVLPAGFFGEDAPDVLPGDFFDSKPAKVGRRSRTKLDERNIGFGFQNEGPANLKPRDEVAGAKKKKFGTWKPGPGDGDPTSPNYAKAMDYANFEAAYALRRVDRDKIDPPADRAHREAVMGYYPPEVLHKITAGVAESAYQDWFKPIMGKTFNTSTFEKGGTGYSIAHPIVTTGATLVNPVGWADFAVQIASGPQDVVAGMAHSISKMWDPKAPLEERVQGSIDMVLSLVMLKHGAVKGYEKLTDSLRKKMTPEEIQANAEAAARVLSRAEQTPDVARAQAELRGLGFTGEVPGAAARFEAVRMPGIEAEPTKVSAPSLASKERRPVSPDRDPLGLGKLGLLGEQQVKDINLLHHERVKAISAETGLSVDELYRGGLPDLEAGKRIKIETQMGTESAAGSLHQSSVDVGHGFFSKLERAIEEKVPNKAKASQVLKTLEAAGVKAEELQYTGMRELLESRGEGTITKSELMKHFEENAVRVEESVRGGEMDKAKAQRDGVPDTQFDSYTLPGGKNYRELLLKLPEWDGKGAMPELFTGGHFSDANVLAHVRFDERVGADGKKVLHVAEIQSDWHQKGRDKGYRSEQPRDTTELDAKMLANRQERQRLMDAANPDIARIEQLSAEHDAMRRQLGGPENQVPDAPFKKNWHELAMRRVIRYAAENGFDRVSWDTGSTIADRFDISKEVAKVEWNPESGWMLGEDHAGKRVIERRVEEKDLPDMIGKEAAERLLAQEKDFHGWHALEGEQLKVGGEGMKGFYDKILPDYANKLGKKFGSRVEAGSVATEGPAWTLYNSATGREYGRFVTEKAALEDLASTQKEFPAEAKDWSVIPSDKNSSGRPMSESVAPAHSLEITPAMRDSVMKEGQPLFQETHSSGAKAGVQFEDLPGKVQKAIITLFEGKADVTSVIHELGHVWRRTLSGQDKAIIDKWLGVPEGMTWEEFRKASPDRWRAAEERFARAIERYIMKGEAPSLTLKGVFVRMRDWFRGVYESITDLGKPVPAEIKEVFDRMLNDGTEKLREQTPERAAENEAAFRGPDAEKAGHTTPVEGSAAQMVTEGPETAGVEKSPDHTHAEAKGAPEDVFGLATAFEEDLARGRSGTTAEALADAGKDLMEKDPQRIEKVYAKLAGREPLTAEDGAVAWYRGQQLKNAMTELGKELKAADDPSTTARLLDDLNGLEAEMEKVYDAGHDLQRSFHQIGQALQIASRQDYSLVSLQSKARSIWKATGEEALPEMYENRLARLSEQLEAAGAERDALRKEIEAGLKKGGRISGPITAERRTAVVKSLLDDLGLGKADPVGGGMASKQTGAVSIPEGAGKRATTKANQLARSYIAEGADTLDAVLARFREDLPMLDQDTVLGLLSGKYKEQVLKSDVAKLGLDRAMRELHWAAEYRTKNLWEKFKIELVDGLTSFNREVQASLDTSFALIQGLPGLVVSPSNWMKAWGPTLRSIANLEKGTSVISKDGVGQVVKRGGVEAFDHASAELHSDPAFPYAKKADVAFSDINGSATIQEEAIAGRLMDKLRTIEFPKSDKLVVDTAGKVLTLPVNAAAELISRSNQGYAVFLNKLRLDLFKKFTSGAYKDPLVMRDAARLANILTGRGDGAMAKALSNKTFGILGYAPRFMLSVWQNASLPLMLPSFKTWHGKGAAMSVWGKQAAMVVGSIVAVNQLKSMGVPGYDVEDDLRSPDFGRIYTPWGSFQLFRRLTEPAVLTSQLVGGQITRKGQYREPNFANNGNLIGRYLYGKAGPTAGLALKAATGEKYNDATGESEPFNLFTPKGMQQSAIDQMTPMALRGAVSDGNTLLTWITNLMGTDYKPKEKRRKPPEAVRPPFRTKNPEVIKAYNKAFNRLPSPDVAAIRRAAARRRMGD